MRRCAGGAGETDLGEEGVEVVRGVGGGLGRPFTLGHSGGVKAGEERERGEESADKSEAHVAQSALIISVADWACQRTTVFAAPPLIAHVFRPPLRPQAGACIQHSRSHGPSLTLSAQSRRSAFASPARLASTSAKQSTLKDRLAELIPAEIETVCPPRNTLSPVRHPDA